MLFARKLGIKCTDAEVQWHISDTLADLYGKPGSDVNIPRRTVTFSNGSKLALELSHHCR
jgi:hypothetical protein